MYMHRYMHMHMHMYMCMYNMCTDVTVWSIQLPTP